MTSVVVSRSDYARVFDRPSFWPMSITAVAGITLACTPWGVRTTGVAPTWMIGVTALWLLGGAVFTFAIAYEEFVARRWAQTLEALRTIAFCSVFGASSSIVASPAYALALVAGASNGLMLQHRNPLVLAGMVVVPVVIRAAAVGHGLVIAFAVGCVGAVLMMLIGREREREHLLREAFDVESQRLDERRSAVSGLAIAMTLHDSLSGAVLVLQARLAAAVTLDAAALGRFVQRARSVIASGTSRGLRALDELRDIADIAWETAMNAKRAQASAVVVGVRVDLYAVRVSCEARGASQAPAGGGRGLRYAKLRAVWRGGDTHFVAGHEARFEAHWPRRFEPPTLSSRFELSDVGLILGGGVALALLSDALACLWLVGLAGLAELGLYAMGSRAHQRMQERFRELGRASALFDARYFAIGERLHEAVERLARCVELESARRALNAFADELTRAMLELEDERAVSAASAAVSPALVVR